jgi:hypothetical protein
MKAAIFNKFSNDLSMFTTRDSFIFLDNKLKSFSGLYKVNTTESTMGHFNAR